MATLVWVFTILSFSAGAYLSYRITKWHYMRKIKKLKHAQLNPAGT